MLHTPASFTPLMHAVDDAHPWCFVFQAGQLLLRESDLGLPALEMVEAMDIAPSQTHPVGLFDGHYCRSSWCERDTPAPQGFVWRSLRSVLYVLDEALLAVAGRAAQIAEWARTHRFCGACGKPMQLLAGERCLRCEACHMMAYPRISPAMMVLIRKGDKVLMAMHTASPSKRFTPLAGFLEAGESIEDAVHREVFEEVGLRVHKLQYFGSQSWPFPHSLMIAFTAEYLDGEIRIDANELSEARWFGPDDEWPEKVPHVSISSILVDAHRPPARA
ncbi:NAD(+) diphosphatase [Massilia sp. PAMC28688]|uniref:NAD(+) diphosphatase n=1 Tax=Massilia sp. PAMC28688 TaxID=2861283 RepID=UPI001C62F8BB|nr:NAD(+) diphosphatase [Massilia sp. PAMC28688]QYF95396.1 NAD(+) diphosphatase [Massilia sp. PAMC28688]